jgi:predicted LPLAT superfamily acyltransferase
MVSKPAEGMQEARVHSRHWAETPERGNATWVAIGTCLATLFRRPLTHRLLYLVALYFFLSAPGARRHAREYLRRVLPREPRARDVFRQVFAFATTILDRLYLSQERYEFFDVSSEGEALMEEPLARGCGAFLLGAHLGSFEMVGALGRQRRGLKVAMAMYQAQASRLTALFQAGRPGSAPEIIPLGHLDAMLRIRDCLEQGKFVGMLADRTIGEAPAHRVTFLGTPTLFPVGPMRLAAALRRPVYFMTALFRGGKRYHVVLRQIADFSHGTQGGREAAVRAAIERYAQVLEECCRADPYNWFNFYDFWQPAQLPDESVRGERA